MLVSSLPFLFIKNVRQLPTFVDLPLIVFLILCWSYFALIFIGERSREKSVIVIFFILLVHILECQSSILEPLLFAVFFDDAGPNFTRMILR